MNWSGALAAVDRPRLVVILGPTAAGKTEVAMEAAGRSGAEIVTADSMTVYRGLEQGTAKPSPQDRQSVPHHLLDVVDPTASFSVARYQELARQAIDAINRRGKLPLLVGGTGLYISAVVDYPDFPPLPPRPEVRRRLTAAAGREGTASLHRELSRLAPDRAEAIHPNDRHRLLRALEIAGREAGERPPPPAYDLLLFGIQRDRAELYRRIEARVDRMFAAGLLEEVAGLRAAGVRREHQSMQALGYREAMAYLEGEYPREHAIYLVKRNTRRYAKRQMTWFRRDPRIEWLTLDGQSARWAGQLIRERVAARLGGIVELG
ncbi:MAG TPA: tRNA (adenosine(37)-N6)-dimethylallyltransferase MiaA [Bacillota bacterium]|nr:tRNA (adenosine(37)-N6)-dimethylallyltransferase MiaA [Bacillota bacterium]